MPQEISIKDLEHLQKHFSDKLDKEQREKFLTLFKDTKENPHIVLEVLKNGEIRQEYIKAYQHKESKDLYYLAIGKDERDITGIPTTKLIKVINDIAKSERVVRAVNFEGISNTAAPLPKQTSPQRSSDIIPQTPQEIIKQAKASGKSVKETAENNTNAWQKEFIEKIKNDESGEILGHYTQGEALVIERKINNKDLDLISITKGENGELFTTYLGKFITQQEAQKRKSFLDNGFKGKEKELLEFLEKEPVNIGSERIAFIPSLDKFFGIPSFNGEYFTEFFIHKHFADSKEPFTSMSLGQGKLEVAKDNLGRYIDKLFKDNGHHFGFLINNEKTMHRLAKDKELYKVKGKGAIETLLVAKMGHIQGAFHRKELGDIDLVWGKVKGKGKEAKGYGLAKIIEKHGDEFEDIAKELDKIIQDGEVVKTHNGYNITLGDYKVGLNIGWNENGIKIGENKWVVTAFDNSKLQSEKQGSNSVSFTKGETLPLNSKDIIPQTTQEIIKQAKASGKSVKETKELIQKNKGLQKHNNTESTPTINNTHSNKELKSSIKENIESTPQNTITQTLKDEIKAADNTQKVAIVTRELEKQNEVLLKQYKELQDIVKNKDYTSLEIQEALDYIATNKKFETDISIVVYNPIDSKDRGVYITKAAPQDERAKQFLKWKYTHLEQKPLMDIIKKNKSDISKLKWDLEFIKNKSNKMRLEKNLARLEKSLLKEEQEYLKSLSLTYDLNTQEGLQKTKDLFYRAKPTQEQIELFESILPVAKKLGVEVRNAIRDPYQVGGNTKNKSGTYFLKENSARVKHSISQADKSETLLHELIHSVTSRAMYAKEKGATNLLNKEQIQAIDNIESIYKHIVEKKDELGFTSWNAREKTGDYGLKNSHEMIAELSNPEFAGKLKRAQMSLKRLLIILSSFLLAQQK